MSRSFKKPIVKDKNTFFQKLGDKRMRKHTKARLKKEDYDNIFEDKSRFVNDYDITDYKSITKDVKDTRK